MAMCRDWCHKHGPEPWLESRERPLVGHLSQSPKRGLLCLEHYYALEDILHEEEFEKAMQTCGKFQADESPESYLPQEIWERIMKKVLFQDLLCWRRVCKVWNLAIVAEEWTSEANRHSQTTIPLIMRCRESSTADAALLALKPDSQKWFKMDIGHALTCLHLYCDDGRKCSPCFQYTTIVSLGLLILTCSCSVHWKSDLCLVICNPVTMKVKPLFVPQLPAEYIPHRKGYFRLAGVIEGTNDKNYKLLFSTVYQNFVESFGVYCVYDSKNSSWRFGRGPLQSLPYILSKASRGGCFYFLYSKVCAHWDNGILRFMRKPLSEPRMSKYDSETDTWSDIAWVPNHEGAEHLPQLVQSGGEVMFVARRRCRNEHSGCPYHNSSWNFFKLDESASSVSELWKYAEEYGSVPYTLIGSSTSHQVYDVANWLRQDTRCEGRGDKVFFYNVQPCTDYSVEEKSSSDSTGMLMPEGKNGGVLVFDGKTRSWLSLPKYHPFQNADKNSSVYKLESFRPSLMAP